jgi:hypothetical protein
MRSFEGFVRGTLATGYMVVLLLSTPYGDAQSQNVAQHQPRNEQSVQGKAPARFAKEVEHEVSTSVPSPEVRVVYLVPSDMKPRRNFRHTASEAIQSLQNWYGVQVGGKTFRLHTPIVETFRTTHPAKWYAENQNGEDRTLWFWNNATTDGFEKTGGTFDDLRFVWVFYVDAEPEDQQRVGGGNGVALLPRQDVLGILGLRTESVCRWVGGLGHELGHAFGLEHPANCENGTGDPGSPECQSLMFLGYLNYCGTLLTPENKAQLDQSSFFSLQDVKAGRRNCSP